MSRFLLKTLLRGLLLLLLLPLTLILILAGLLSSESANRWVMDKLTGMEPRLQLQLEEGQLWRGWQFSHIGWQDEDRKSVV